MLGSKRGRAALLAVALLAVAAPAAMAARVESGGTFVLAAGEVEPGNLYAFGDTVRIEGTVKGDLVAAGSTVEVARGGRVEGDVLAAAQGVIVRGDVGGDVRAAGFTVQVEDGATVAGDLSAAGFSIGLAADAGADSVLAAGYQGLIDGRVAHDVWFAGSALDVTGRVDGNVVAQVDAPSSSEPPPMQAFPFITVKPPRMVTSGLHVARTAQIAGDLDYGSPGAGEVPSGVVGGRTTFDKQAVPAATTETQPERSTAVRWVVEVVKDYVALLIVGLLLALIAPRMLRQAAAFLRTRPAPAIGWGVGTAAIALLLLFVVPAVTIVLMVLIGLLHVGPLGKPVLASAALLVALFTVGLYALSWVGRVVAGTWIGRWLTGLAGRGGPAYAEDDAEVSAPRPLAAMAVGLLVYAILANLPYGIGFLVNLIVVLFGLGAVVAWLWGNWSARRATAAAVATPA